MDCPTPAARHATSYATAALKAGVHLKIVSARLGRHASETRTGSAPQDALPGMDREAAGTIAALFPGQVADEAVSGSVSEEDENGQSDDLWLPVFPGSGDRI